MPNCLWEICKFVFAILLYPFMIIKLVWEVVVSIVMAIVNGREFPRTDTFGNPHDVAYYETRAEYLGSLRVSRYVSEEGTYIYVNCRNNRWNTVFKALLFEGEGPVSGTQCFVYVDHVQNGATNGIRITSPVSVDFVNEIFSHD